MNAATYTVEELVRQDRAADFDRYGPTRTQVGQHIVAIAGPVGSSRPSGWGKQRVFQVGLAATRADNDRWMKR